MFTVYLLHSQKRNRYYIGFTTDLEIRIAFHQNAEARKFTAKADDWIVFLEIPCDSREQALAIEAHIKRMKSKTYNEHLKTYPEMVEKLKVKYSSLDC